MQNAKSGNPPVKHPNVGGGDRTSRRNAGPVPRSTISWGDVPNQLLRDAVVAVTDAGAAFLISTTTDRGALSITVLDGNDKIREYPHNVDEAELTLRWLVSMFASD
jgi:hypothetical protein